MVSRPLALARAKRSCRRYSALLRLPWIISIIDSEKRFTDILKEPYTVYLIETKWVHRFLVWVYYYFAVTRHHDHQISWKKRSDWSLIISLHLCKTQHWGRCTIISIEESTLFESTSSKSIIIFIGISKWIWTENAFIEFSSRENHRTLSSQTLVHRHDEVDQSLWFRSVCSLMGFRNNQRLILS